MGFLMLKDHKSDIHLEGITFDKVVRNSKGTDQFLNVLLFNNCQLEIMRFVCSFDNMLDIDRLMILQHQEPHIGLFFRF